MPPVNKTIKLRNKMLGVVLQDARQDAGKSIRETAKTAGMTAAALSAYERGRRSITLPELEALAYIYDVPIRRFLEGKRFQGKQIREDVDFPRLAMVRQKMISTRLRQLRAECNAHLKDLSKRTGISSRRIKAYETGDRPIPLPELEAISSSLEVDVDYFLDLRGPVGEWELDRESTAQFEALPSDIRRFASLPLHEPYIRLAMRLSEMPAGKLRNIAEALLDITL